jgi:hypothetical protein
MNRAARVSSDRAGTHIMASLDIQCFTFEPRHRLLDDLTAALGDCGGWVLERRTLSATNLEFRVEIQLRAILDLYAALVATGLELTRSGHEVFTELCTRRKHMHITTESGQVIVLRLEISFLEDITLHSLLVSNSSVA